MVHSFPAWSGEPRSSVGSEARWASGPSFEAETCADLASRLRRREPEMCAHLERLFQPGMSWSNYGKWHVDHIHPVCKFDLRRSEDRIAVNALDNLQPLWAAENLTKSSK